MAIDPARLDALHAERTAHAERAAILRRQIATLGQTNASPAQISGLAEAEAAIRLIDDALRSTNDLAVVDQLGPGVAYLSLERRFEDYRQRNDAATAALHDEIQTLARAMVDVRNADDARAQQDAHDRAARQVDFDAWRTRVEAALAENAQHLNAVVQSLIRVRNFLVVVALVFMPILAILVDRYYFR